MSLVDKYYLRIWCCIAPTFRNTHKRFHYSKWDSKTFSNQLLWPSAFWSTVHRILFRKGVSLWYRTTIERSAPQPKNRRPNATVPQGLLYIQRWSHLLFVSHSLRAWIASILHFSRIYWNIYSTHSMITNTMNYIIQYCSKYSYVDPISNCFCRST